MIDSRTRFHVAKLALFNVRVLNAVEQNRASNGQLDELVKGVASNFGVALPVSLLHQGTFLGVIYSSLVWLWDHPRVRDDDELLGEVATSVELVDFVGVLVNQKPRDVNAKSLLRALRNATAHGRVTINDECFDFTDINPRDTHDVVKLRLSWEATGRIAEGVFWALNKKLWPEASQR